MDSPAEPQRTAPPTTPPGTTTWPPHPDHVRVELNGRAVAVTADQLAGPERDEAWQQITTAAPGFATYQTKTDRELPIIRLTPQPND